MLKPQSPADYGRWLSIDLEALFNQLAPTPGAAPSAAATSPDFDLIIIGSGYGGAIAADHFAGASVDGKPLKICLLERGREYLPGSFPSTLQQLPRQARVATSASDRPMGDLQGLYDIRLGEGLTTVAGNGLGGGSLINAGVMAQALPQVFKAPWPQSLQAAAEWQHWYPKAATLLGATLAPGSGQAEPNTITSHARHQQQPLAKTLAMQQLGRATGKFDYTPITVALTDKTTNAGVQLKACQLCGDCATGCNFGAKESLDTNLLARAHQAGTTIVTDVTVLSLQPLPNPNDTSQPIWQLHLTHTNAQLSLRDQHQPITLTAAKVIVAAGTLGSTELLLRSQQQHGLQLSQQLGKKVSGNGDMLAIGFRHSAPINAVAEQTSPPAQRHIGPTITSMIDLRDPASGYGYVIEEMAVPGALKQVFAELATTAWSVGQLQHCDASQHGTHQLDPWAVDAMANTALYAIMSDDQASGSIAFGQPMPACQPPTTDQPQYSQGAVFVHWPELPKQAIFTEQITQLETLAEASGLDGDILGNPIWRPLPNSMDHLVNGARGPLLTVHPLGGCPAGDDASEGVVNHCGQVFNPQAGANAVYPNLAVLDGAAIPTALGINPALTISAFALRACHKLQDQWGWQTRASSSVAAIQRPVYVALNPADAQPQTATKIAITERLISHQQIVKGPGNSKLLAELSLQFAPVAVRQLIRPQGAVPITTQPQGSTLRLYDFDTWQRIQQADLSPQQREATLSAAAWLSVPVGGTLQLMQRQASSKPWRTVRGLWAWLRNRGLRDIAQAVCLDKHAWRKRKTAYPPAQPRPFKESVKDALKLASRAGEVRLWRYQLQTTAPAQHHPNSPLSTIKLPIGSPIHGDKRFTYSRASNPLVQLSEMTVNHCPNLPWLQHTRLCLHLPHLVRSDIPLLHITQQNDEVSALADLASLGTYLTRAIVSTHVWSLRQPDTPLKPNPQRLAGAMPGMPPPSVTTLQVDKHNNLPVFMRLAHYPGNDASLPPVLLIHGYSASSTTWAHPKLPHSLARYLHQQGRHVYLIDMRSSSGLASAMQPWAFEQMAAIDIPLAVNHIYQAHGQQKIDIVAHCMGSAMFSMAVLSADDALSDLLPSVADSLAASNLDALPPGLDAMRQQLPQRINKAVLSQVTPVMVLSPVNRFRAMLASYFMPLLGDQPYHFGYAADATPAASLLDRLLSLLPYPEHEFVGENPRKPCATTRWVRTRHRMDALYNRTFNLRNMPAAALTHIDDLFGPLNLQTVAQVTHFGIHRCITDRQGRCRFVLPDKLRQHWQFDTLTLHGQDNGLVDIATAQCVATQLQGSGLPFSSKQFANTGHQDLLIGNNAPQAFAAIGEFLQRASTPQQLAPLIASAHAPSLGPVWGLLPNSTQLGLSLGYAAGQQPPQLVITVPAKKGQTPSADDINAAVSAATARQPKPQCEHRWLKLQLPRQADCDGLLVLLIHNAAKPNLAAASNAAITNWLAQHDVNEAFITWPALPADKTWQLALGACQYPRGLLYRDLAFNSYRRMAGQADDLHLVIFTGDQVYVDASAGLYDPGNRFDRYVRPYHQLYTRPEVRQLLGKVPSITMLDDHELIDNWQPFANMQLHQRTLQQGVASYLLFQRPAGNTPHKIGQPLWYHGRAYDLPYFMLDTRTERQARGLHYPTCGADGLLGAKQWQALRDWLARDDQQHLPKLIVSPAALLPLGKHNGLDQDGWHGYPASRDALLQYIAVNNIKHVVFLSGDEHCAMAVSANLKYQDKTTRVLSIHTGGLHAPFDFANSHPDDFIANYPSGITAGNPWQVAANVSCSYTTMFGPTGDGFTRLGVLPDNNGWRLQITFDRHSGAFSTSLSTA